MRRPLHVVACTIVGLAAPAVLGAEESLRPRYAQPAERWKEEGRAEKQDRRDTEKDRRRYIEGEFADYIEH